MTRKRWEKVKDICAAALERTAAQRREYIDAASGDDASLRAEVESLIASFESDPSFLEQSAGKYAECDATAEGNDPFIGQVLGPYRVVCSIAFGGMGAVYLAERADEAYSKQVALKLLRSDRFLTSPPRREVMLRRFRAERQALACLEHPNIARLLDGGATADGTPYLVMEYIEGEPIHHYCDSRTLSISKRLRLFQDVCSAVHFAHQRLIVHRDIKPSNILVTPNGEPKLLDFGIAKVLEPDATDADALTRTLDQPMTPEYASPEQVRNEPITTASDIYSLGVVLYELLCGHRPYRFNGAPRGDIVRLICEQEPEKPSTAVSRIEEQALRDGGSSTVTPESVGRTRGNHPDRLRRLLAGDLDWITMKAMEKDRARRYATASDLGTDIARHLDHQPVMAGPPSRAYRVRKFVRRHRAGVAAAAMIALALLGGALGTTWQAVRAIRERDRAIAAEGAAQDRLDEAEAVSKFLSDMLAAVRPQEQGKDVSVRQVLDQAATTVALKMGDHPLVGARLRETIGNSYFTLGVYEEAERHLLDSAATYRQLLGENDRRTTKCLNTLAVTMADRGQFSAAEANLRSTLAVEQRALGDEHPQTLRSLTNLAMVLDRQAKYDEAESLLRKAVDLQTRLLGEEHALTLMSLNNLARTLDRRGNCAEAEVLHRKVLEIQRRVLRDDHPDTLISMHNIAVELLHQGKLSEAATLHRTLLETQRRVLGEEHAYTLRSMSNLAVVLRQQGRYAEADGLFRSTLETQRRVLGNEHPDTLLSIVDLSSTLLGEGKYTEMESLLHPALETLRRVLGDEHPTTLWAMTNLGLLRSEQGRYADAESLHRRTLEIKRWVLGEENGDTLQSMIDLANTLLEQNKYAEAKSLSEQVLEPLRATLGEEHPFTLAAMSNFGVLLFKQGLHAEAESLHRKTLETKRRLLGETHPETLSSIVDLANVLSDEDKTVEAERLYREALVVRRERGDDTHPATALVLHNHGAMLLRLGRLGEAEPLLREALAIRLAKFGGEHETVAATRKALAATAQR